MRAVVAESNSVKKKNNGQGRHNSITRTLRYVKSFAAFEILYIINKKIEKRKRKNKLRGYFVVVH